MPELIGGLEGGCEDDGVGQRLTSGVAQIQEQPVLSEGPGGIVVAENLTQPGFVYLANSGVERDRSEVLQRLLLEVGALHVRLLTDLERVAPVTPAGRADFGDVLGERVQHIV